MNRDQQDLIDDAVRRLEVLERIDRCTTAMDDGASPATARVQDTVIRNLEIVWKTIHNNLPDLRSRILDAQAR